jgi:tetratricopeptide (TPR) repeat protein
MLLAMLRDRYVVTEETLRFAAAALEPYQQGLIDAELPLTHFGYGFALLLHGSLKQADLELREALALASRAGDQALEARCLTYLGLGARMRGQIEETADYALRTLERATSGGTKEYVGAAYANQSWVALKQDDLESTIALAGRAQEIWDSITLDFAFRWMGLLPAISAHLRQSAVDKAVALAQSTLEQKKHSLPGIATDALARAVAHWKDDNPRAAQAALEIAVQYLAQTGHL